MSNELSGTENENWAGARDVPNDIRSASVADRAGEAGEGKAGRGEDRDGGAAGSERVERGQHSAGERVVRRFAMPGGGHGIEGPEVNREWRSQEPVPVGTGAAEAHFTGPTQRDEGSSGPLGVNRVGAAPDSGKQGQGFQGAPWNTGNVPEDRGSLQGAFGDRPAWIAADPQGLQDWQPEERQSGWQQGTGWNGGPGEGGPSRAELHGGLAWEPADAGAPWDYPAGVGVTAGASGGDGGTWQYPGHAGQWDPPGAGMPGSSGAYGGGAGGRPFGQGAGSKSSGMKIGILLVVAALIGGLVGAVTVAVSRGSSSGGNRTVYVSKGGAGPALLASGAQIPTIVQKLMPAVVGIKAQQVSQNIQQLPYGIGGGGGSGNPFGSQVATVEGSGMIISPGGEVVTNNHVIEGDTNITVTLYGSTKSFPARVIGADPTDDVALLQIENAPGNLPTVTFGSSTSLQVGDAVIAIGNALGLSLSSPTVTSGIVSALNRSVQAGSGSGVVASESLSNMIQTDAAINSGNSGGPLVDSEGQVIGMNTAVAGSSAGNAPAENIGFAIPSAQILDLLPQLRKGGTQGTSHAYLGVYMTDDTSQVQQAYGLVPSAGALVTQVVAGSPASSAGLQAGDVIVAVNGKAVRSASDLQVDIQSRKPGDSVTLTLWRGQEKLKVSVTLASSPIG